MDSDIAGELTAAQSRAEIEFLDKVSGDYPDLESPFEQAVRRAAANVARALVPTQASILELGCADGYMSSLLSPLAASHVIVDATPRFIEAAKARAMPNVTFVESLFESYAADTPFDLVVMSFVLEHVRDPVRVMARARQWIKPDTGRILAVVPNMRALSRELARAMGVVGELADLTPNDHAHGHRRCYDRVSFDRDITEAGGEVLSRGGLVLKPFANFQMDRMIDASVIGREQLDGLETLGHQYPDHCGSIYAVMR